MENLEIKKGFIKGWNLHKKTDCNISVVFGKVKFTIYKKNKKLKTTIISRKNFSNLNYRESIEQALKSLKLKRNDIVVITGSIYLAGEVLNLN